MTRRDEEAPTPLLKEARPVFSEPWEAQALAMAVRLREAGHFTAKEWAETLGSEIARARALGATDDGSTYYSHVLAALERLVTEKGLVAQDVLVSRKEAWADAYHSTPHGQPVVLSKK